MAEKTAVMFGGGGFVGRRAAALLAERGWRLVIASRDPARVHRLKAIGDVGQLSIMPWRPDDEERIEALLRGADGVVNCVGMLFERRSGDFRRAHAELPERLGRIAAKAGVERFVQLSAIGALPSSDALYAQTKAAGEAALKKVHRDATILRPSVIFGRGDGFLNRFASMASMSPFLPLIGGGGTRFQPVAVGDVGASIVACLEDEAFAGRTFELGGPNALTLRETLELIMQTTGMRRILLPLPFSVARAMASVFELLPTPPLTRDQLTMLETDNVVGPGAETIEDLGIEPTPIAAAAPEILAAYRRKGAFLGRSPARRSEIAQP